ncbi:ABC transporter ATP-binding protein [Inquilinus sp.]|jgi:iron(III) transport system ATP-binding protein|uniref:ABC transporter ATP-binding protein n=1 Tax=Inquilinus sp. TaxID=1932117 RepID=UPI003784F897
MHARPTDISQADAVETAGLGHRYGAATILDGIDLSLRPGRILALLGPSGCGKTTLLRLVAGLLAPSAGRVSIAGTVVADAASSLMLPPERRGLGMVFQDYALWPHLSVGANVSFPLEMQRVSKAERATRVAAALDRVGLSGFGDRPPSALSGGQQQRVAIARAIVGEPRLVLFDEPLSNLDKELRESLVDEIGSLVRSLGLTAIYVTHDQAEAFALADAVAVMRGGGILQLDAPERLVAEPANATVAEFLNLGSLLPVEARGDAWCLAGTTVRLAPRAAGSETAATALVPRAALSLVDPATPGALAATVLRSQFRGDRHLLTLRLDAAPGVTLQAAAPSRRAEGSPAGLAVEAGALRLFPGPTS